MPINRLVFVAMLSALISAPLLAQTGVDETVQPSELEGQAVASPSDAPAHRRDGAPLDSPVGGINSTPETLLESSSGTESIQSETHRDAAPTAANIDLRDVVDSPVADELFAPAAGDAVQEQEALAGAVRLSAVEETRVPNRVRQLLGVDVPPGTTTRLDWTPSKSFSGMAVDTPVLVVNGAWDGPTLCLTAAIHGDELNGIEMVRRVLYDLAPEKLHGMVVGVPIVNLLGFSRNSRYLPDRRDLNRYFPGNPRGSVASRLAHAFFQDVIQKCDALVDLHTGSFYRTNITQLRADMRNPKVAEFASLFGDIPVLNTGGNGNSLRAATVRAGIPAVTLEAGEPMRMQVRVVEEGVKAINTLLEKNGMYPSFSLWAKPSPAYYRSAWVRANASGILFSKVKLGGRVKKGDVLGEVINPVTNEKKLIESTYEGRVLGMALDQFVLPGFAAYHIGILEPRAAAAAASTGDEEADTDDDGQLESENKPTVLEEPKPLSPEEEGFDD